MRTYEERMQIILVKARSQKRVRLVSRLITSLLTLALVVCGVLLLPEFGSVNGNLQAPALNGSVLSQPSSPDEVPYSTVIGTYYEPDVAIPTINQNPDYTMGPPSDTDVPQAYLKFNAAYIKTTQPSPVNRYPAIHLIRSVDELDSFCKNNNQINVGFEAVEKQADIYDQAFFEKHSLILLMIEESSGSVRHNVSGIEIYGNGYVNILLDRSAPEIGTADMAYWYIFIEAHAVISKGTWIGFEWVNMPIVTPESTKPVDHIDQWEQDEMRNAFIKQFTNPKDGYTPDDVSIDRVIAVFGDKYVLFVDGIFLYSDWIVSETVNDVTFTYGSSQKMYLYYSGYYYGLQEAYDLGLLNDGELLKLHNAYCSEYPFFYDAA